MNDKVNGKTLDEWMNELRLVAISQFGYVRQIANQLSGEDWGPHWLDGQTPYEALAESVYK